MGRRSGLLAMSAMTCIAVSVGIAASSAARSPAQAPTPAVSSPAPQVGACESLAGLKLDGVDITLATSQAENTKVPNAGLTSMYGKAAVVANGLPAFCRVVGHIHAEKGSDIGFEVWLPPTAWNGRLHGIGIGGFAGGIDYFGLGSAVKAGQVGLATDTGHSGTMMESGWAKGNPASVRDYSSRAVHLSTVAAKKVIAAFYGRGPDKSYFVGCSGGGRQGLMEAGRFPEDYDGVVAGAPAASFTGLIYAHINAEQAQLATGDIKSKQMRFLQEEVLRQCDPKDGQVDGLVADPRQCRFDASKLACGTSSDAQCFSPGQIAALEKIHRGARDSRGRPVSAGFLPSGSEVGNPSGILGWEGYITRSGGQAGGAGLARGILEDLVQKPFATTATFDFDKDPARLNATGLPGELNAPTDLRKFFARGGKLIIWHGWADAAIPPEHALRYYDAVRRQSGGAAKNQVRLFMVPGVQHCSGGLGPDVFGQQDTPRDGESPERSMVAALQAWVEGKRAAPETFIGRRHAAKAGDTQERQRLMCAWPKKDKLRAGADPDQAASYTCV